MRYLSRVSFTRQGIRAQCRAGTIASPFREHQMIWDLFDNAPDQQRDFLYRREDRPSQPPFYYLLSAREAMTGDALLQVETKSFEPCLQPGDRLRFELRANAVVTRKPDDGSKRRIRRDIIEARLDEYKEKYPNPSDRPPPAIVHQEAAEAWLQRQGEQHG
ncbi:MAG TPA: type I-E CRISPR-associated protein Cas6/Cse3/CasE, partial [Gammaproteobacteria bacterium]|nr:type I-E CRISPR-associated protein Cas6/Cse3/CasE [Gammaproteobacteria bacterium]